MNRRLFLQFASLAALPFSWVFGQKAKAEGPQDVKAALERARKELHSWVGQSWGNLYQRYRSEIEFLHRECPDVDEVYGPRPIQLLRDSVLVRIGLSPVDYFLHNGIRSNALVPPEVDVLYSSSDNSVVTEVYNISLYERVEGIQQFTGRKGYWRSLTK